MLHRDRAILVVIDVQAKLLPAIEEADVMIEQIRRLVRGFQIIGAPILVTEQYPRGLGKTDPGILQTIENNPVTGSMTPCARYEKMTMSCMLDPQFRAALEETARDQVVLCGIEAHVCVYQTARHLAEASIHVEVAADAVSSRSARNREIALRRMTQEGIRLTCVETAVFEMLERCGTEQFRSWVDVIR